MKIGVASGLGNACEILEDIRDVKADYQAIEIMAYPRGCIAGGGQPYHHGNAEIIKNAGKLFTKRIKVKKSEKPMRIKKFLSFIKTTLASPSGNCPTN